MPFVDPFADIFGDHASDPYADILDTQETEAERRRKRLAALGAGIRDAGGIKDPDTQQLPKELDFGYGRIGRNIASGMKAGADFIAHAPDLAGAGARAFIDAMSPRDAERQQLERQSSAKLEQVQLQRQDEGGNSFGLAEDQRLVKPQAPLPPIRSILPDIVEETFRSSREERERLKEEAAARGVEYGQSPEVAALAYAAPQTLGNVLDPANALLGGTEPLAGVVEKALGRRMMAQATEREAAALTERAVLHEHELRIAGSVPGDPELSALVARDAGPTAAEMDQAKRANKLAELFGGDRLGNGNQHRSVAPSLDLQEKFPDAIIDSRVVGRGALTADFPSEARALPSPAMRVRLDEGLAHLDDDALAEGLATARQRLEQARTGAGSRSSHEAAIDQFRAEARRYDREIFNRKMAAQPDQVSAAEGLSADVETIDAKIASAKEHIAKAKQAPDHPFTEDYIDQQNATIRRLQKERDVLSPPEDRAALADELGVSRKYLARQRRRPPDAPRPDPIAEAVDPLVASQVLPFENAPTIGATLSRMVGTTPALRDVNPPGVARNSQEFLDWVRTRFESYGEYVPASRRFVNPELTHYVHHDLPRRIEKAAGEEHALNYQMQTISQDIDEALRLTAKEQDAALDGGYQLPTSSEEAAFGANMATVARTPPGERVAVLRRQMNSARRAGDLSSLPERVQVATRKAGDFIDYLTQQMIDNGVVDEAGAKVLRENMGRYLHTSHAAFDVKDFAEVISKRPEFDRAYKFLQNLYPDKSDEEVIGIMYQMINRTDKNAAITFGKKGAVQPMDLGELMHAKEIPQELRDLMGIHEDFIVNFEKSALMMSHDLATHRLLSDIAEEGLANGLLQKTAKGQFSVELGGGAAKTPLSALNTVPEFAKLIDGVIADSKGGWYTYLAGVTKFGKVGLSPQTQVRNWESNIIMSIANGRWLDSPAGYAKQVGYLKDSLLLTADMVSKSDRRLMGFLKVDSLEQLEKEIAEAIQYNVVGTGTHGREFSTYVDAIQAGIGREGGTLAKVTRAAGKPVGAVGEVAGRLYAAGDDFWKFYNWKSEIDGLTWAHAGDKLSTATPESIKAEAAEIINQQLQNYARTSPIAQTLSRNPVVGAFATFKFEMPRNMANIAKRAYQEFALAKQTGNVRWAVLGGKRVIGLGAALTVWGTALTYSKHKIGMSDDQEEALRHLALRPGAQNAQFTLLSHEGTKYRYFDSNFVDPYNTVQRAYVALVARPGSIGDRLKRFASEITTSYLAPDLLTTTVGEIAFNKKIGNIPGIDAARGDVRNMTDPASQQLKDIGAHAFKGLAPGGAVTAQRIADPKHSRSDEVMALLGPRITTVDVQESLGYKIGDFTRDRSEVSKLYSRRKLNAKGAEEVIAAKRLAEAGWKDVYHTLQEYVEDARTLKISRTKILAMLHDNDIRKDVAEALLAGRYISYANYRRGL